MKAWLCERFGPPAGLRLTDWPSRAPGRGEVRVRIDSAALNFPDLLSIAVVVDYPVHGIDRSGLAIDGRRAEDPE